MGLLAIAVFEVNESKDEECLAVCRKLYEYLHSKGYSEDVTYRDSKKSNTYLNIRMWASKEAALKAHQDPEVHKIWAQMAKVSKMKKIYEDLDKVISDAELAI